MERFDVLDISTLGERGVLMSSSIDGEWVRYEDFEREVAMAEAILIGVIERAKNEAKEYECNCEDLYNELTVSKQVGLLGRPRHWICPAHGYKKL